MKNFRTLPYSRRWLLFLFANVLFITRLSAQNTRPVTDLQQHTPNVHLFEHATLTLKPGETIEDGSLLIRDGRVVAAGKNISAPPDAVRHDLSGKWIFPGFIDPASDFGAEKPQKGPDERAPQYDSRTSGPMAWNQAVKPEYRVTTSWNASASDIAALRGMGFTTINVVPQDGIFRGTAALLQLRGGKIQDDMLDGQSASCLSFEKGVSRQEYPSSLMGSIALIRQTFYDADWYRRASALKDARPRPEYNQSLEQLNMQLGEKMPLIFEVKEYQNILRAEKMAKEFGLSFIYRTGGDEFNLPDAFSTFSGRLILPLNFPKGYPIRDPADARQVSLAQLKAWELAPRNPAMLAEDQVAFSFTLTGLKDRKDFWPMLRKALAHGLSAKDALAALTTVPAAQTGQSDLLGTLEPGKLANFFIADANVFEAKECTVYEVYVSGTRFVYREMPTADIRGRFSLDWPGNTLFLKVGGTAMKPEAKMIRGTDTLKTDFSYDGSRMLIVFAPKSQPLQTVRLSGTLSDNAISGMGENPDGTRFSWKGIRVERFTGADTLARIPRVNTDSIGTVWMPNCAYGFTAKPQQREVVIRHATVWTNTSKGVLKDTDVLLRNGKIAAVGGNLKPGPDALVIDGTGKHVTAGIIDEHSHVAISQGVNEGSHAVTAEVSISDVVNRDDVNVYRLLSGGVTAAQLLHGSANPIGGQSALVKMRWGATGDAMQIENATGRIKFALGENVKQSNWGDHITVRYPQTRMGVEQVMRDAFGAARDYREAKETWNKSGEKSGALPVRKNLQYETLLEIMDGKRLISCHSYQQGEILMLMRVAESFGFRINTFTHILEGYKVAPELKTHGASASSFSDWWAYKYEVVDAIPYNCAIMQQAGINVCVNSDDAEMGRRLNQEAAKAVLYGGVSEEDALKMVTLNPAKALRLDDRMGSVKEGMDGDVVVWSAHPLSVYARAEHTFVDGILMYDLNRDAQLRESIRTERARLIQKMLKAGEFSEQLPPAGDGEMHCETLESRYNYESGN